MHLLNRPLSEYWAAVWKFFLLAFILVVVITLLRLNDAYPSNLETILTLVGLMIVIWAGVSVVRVRGFNLFQAALVGFILSLASAWSLPIFHPAGEAFFLFITNGIIYALVAVAGGWVGKRIFGSKIVK
jgi:hypothetical protein